MDGNAFMLASTSLETGATRRGWMRPVEMCREIREHNAIARVHHHVESSGLNIFESFCILPKFGMVGWWTNFFPRGWKWVQAFMSSHNLLNQKVHYSLSFRGRSDSSNGYLGLTSLMMFTSPFPALGTLIFAFCSLWLQHLEEMQDYCLHRLLCNFYFQRQSC